MKVFGGSAVYHKGKLKHEVRCYDLPTGDDKMTLPNDLPRLDINIAELIKAVDALLVEAEVSADKMGAVNWGDLGIVDIEYRMSMMHPYDDPRCVVSIEEASPTSKLAAWLNSNLDSNHFPNTWIECEW